MLLTPDKQTKFKNNFHCVIFFYLLKWYHLYILSIFKFVGLFLPRVKSIKKIIISSFYPTRENSKKWFTLLLIFLMIKSDICFHLKVILNTATFFNVIILGNYRGLSSPDLKALVGYSNILITFCPASVSLSVRPSVCLSV